MGDIPAEFCHDQMGELAERVENLEEHYSMLAKEISGFIHAHEISLRQDSGNSNIKTMEYRLKKAKELMPEKLAKLRTEF